MMSLSFILWLVGLCLALIVIAFLNWYSLRHIQRATDAELSYRVERRRVLANYTTMRFRRIDDTQYLQEQRTTAETSER